MRNDNFKFAQIDMKHLLYSFHIQTLGLNDVSLQYYPVATQDGIVLGKNFQDFPKFRILRLTFHIFRQIIRASLTLNTEQNITLLKTIHLKSRPRKTMGIA